MIDWKAVGITLSIVGLVAFVAGVSSVLTYEYFHKRVTTRVQFIHNNATYKCEKTNELKQDKL